MNRMNCVPRVCTRALIVACLVGGASTCWSVQALADWPTNSSANLALCTAANNQTSPVVATDGVGGAFFAWVDQRSTSTGADIYVSHVLASGTIDPAIPAGGLPVCTASATQFNCRIVEDGLGGAYVSWQDNRSGTSDVYAAHVLSTGHLDPVWPANGLAVCTATNYQYIPEIAADGAHGAFVAWYDLRNGTDKDIYAQHVELGGYIDPSWPASGLPVCVAAGDQQYVHITSDGLGGAIAVWDDYRGGAESDIYAQRILPTGNVDPAWPANGAALCAATGSQNSTALVGDGSGGAVVAWVDFRAGATSDIYATHVLATGAIELGWPTDGRALCTAAGNQSAVAVTEDVARNAIVTWTDARDGVYTKIYAQRAAGPDGATWVSDGVRVSSRIGNQTNAKLVADGRGGAVVAWEDGQSGASDIYAQHILASGDLDASWSLEGKPVCTALYLQQQPRLILEGSGGAILTWQDTRSGSQLNADVYAQRIQADGQLGGTVVGVPEASGLAFSLDPVWPNPSHDGVISVSFSLASESRVVVDLLDLAGRRVMSNDLGVLSPGHSSTAFNVLPRRMPPGLFFVRVSARGAWRTTRVAIVN